MEEIFFLKMGTKKNLKSKYRHKEEKERNKIYKQAKKRGQKNGKERKPKR